MTPPHPLRPASVSARHPTRGGVVSRRPAAGALAALPRRGGGGRVPVDRAGAVRLSAHRPGPAGGRDPQPRADRLRRDRLHRIAPRARRLGPDLGACRGHRRTDPGHGRRTPRRHPLLLARRQDGRGPGGPHAHPRAVAGSDGPDGAARPGGPGALRAPHRRPPARGHPHRQRGERDPLPRRHRSLPRLALPRHRALRLLRRRQRQAHRDVRGAPRLPPPQAGRPRDPGGGGGGPGPVRPGRGAGRDVRTARWRARSGAGPGGGARPGRRPVRDRGAGHVPVRPGQAAPDRTPHPRVPPLLRNPGPGTAV